MIWHSSDKDSVTAFFGTDENSGLSSQKAEELHDLYVEQTVKSKPSFIKLLSAQLNNYIALIMIVAVAFCIVISVVSGSKTWILSAAVAVIIVIDALFNALQQYTADKIKHGVKSTKKSVVKVIRDGKETEIDSDYLVTGDIMLLNAGDYIPADARLLQTANFRCDEYILTGETVDVEKDAYSTFEDIAPLSHRRNMVFEGCSVMHGSAKAIVTDTGTNTEYAKSLKLKKASSNNDSAYKSVVNLINKYSVIISCVTAFIIFLLTVLFNLQQSEMSFSGLVANSFADSLAVVLAAVPEALPATISVILWAAIKKLQRNGNLILKTSTLQNAANISVICADKTGVLTPDNMCVAKVFDGKSICDTESEEPSDTAKAVVKMAMICGNSLDYSDSSSETVEDSSAAALADFCRSFDSVSVDECKNMYPMLASVPFDNEHRMITTVNMINGKYFVISKGSPASLLKCCVNSSDKLNEIAENLADDALRVIAVGIKEIESVPAIPGAAELESGLSLLGFIGLSDTPDAETVKTVEECKNAGIRTVMITGDALPTARAVARRIGILPDNMNSVTGKQIEEMSDAELDLKVNSYSVFARVSPTDRYRIVRALQHNNETVAVTGSRNSDAPVLRKANVGFSPDSNVSDVVCNAADVTSQKLTLKNISDVIKAAKSTYFNVRRVIYYFLSCNIGELLAFFLCTLFFGKPMLLAAQLLWINLITDILPSLSVGLSPTDENAAHIRPQQYKKIFNLRSVISIGIQSIFLCIFSLVAYKTGCRISIECGRTMALGIFGFAEILHILPSYSDKLIINTDLRRQKTVLINVAASVLLMLGVMLLPIKSVLGLTDLTGGQWTTIILMSVILALIDELIKIGFYLYKKFSK